ncbi:MAG: hypothetical protein IKZ82_10985 [Clostridia bacterium]|nr:hypothetical protein [Clostridia bacterium]
MDTIESIRLNVKRILGLIEERELKLRIGLPLRPFLIALDGRCGSGKTTLATALRHALERRIPKPVITVVHMDDFYLRPEQRTVERFQTPGGNVDYERFNEEVLDRLASNKDFTYRPFDCSSMTLGESVAVHPSHVVIIEGSYSLHPKLRENYDLKVFLDIEPEEQQKRILMRNGEEKLLQFKERWIPLEELYFDKCAVRECADLIIE